MVIKFFRDAIGTQHKVWMEFHKFLPLTLGSTNFATKGRELGLTFSLMHSQI